MSIFNQRFYIHDIDLAKPSERNEDEITLVCLNTSPGLNESSNYGLKGIYFFAALNKELS